MYHNFRCPVCGSNYIEVIWQEHTGHITLQCNSCHALGGTGICMYDIMTAWRTEVCESLKSAEDAHAAS